MITRDELKERLVQFINTNKGCKTTELKHYKDTDVSMALTKYNLRTLIDELIDEQKIAFIKYKLPDNTVKLFLLPKDSSIILLENT